MSNSIMKHQKTISPSIIALAIITGSFLSGAMLSLSVITIPVFLETNTKPNDIIHQWVTLYSHGHVLLPTLSVTTCFTYLYIASKKRAAQKLSSTGFWVIYIAAGIITVAMIPFTLLVMVPTNDTLFGFDESIQATRGNVSVPLETVQSLVRLWAKMHFTRSLFPLAGAVVGTYGLLKEMGL